jgi:hypothetical protein
MRIRRMALLSAAATALGCSGSSSGRPSADEAKKIQGEVERVVRDAYDLSKPGVAERMLSLYPAGRVISATGGRVLTTRDSVEQGIRYFWNAVGTNMRDPKWIWDGMWTDVLSPTSAVVTATYRIPHLNPRNEPHTLGGAMTMVLEKQAGHWLIVQEHLSDLPQTQTSQDTMPTHQHH